MSWMVDALRKVNYAKETKRLLKEALSLADINTSGSENFRDIANKVQQVPAIDDDNIARPLKIRGIKSSTLDYSGYYSDFKKASRLFEIYEADWSFLNSKNLSSFTKFFYNYKGDVLDLSNFKVGSSVTNTSYMFNGAEYITELANLDKWDISNVTIMLYMFKNCKRLTSLNVSNWDTSKVTSLHTMFSSCHKLAFLDVSNWNTTNVTNMNSVFSFCYKLPSLDVSKWDTSNVTTMNSMFYNCRSLRRLDLSKWDTSKVTDMSNMISNGTDVTDVPIQYNVLEVTFGNNWASNASCTNLYYSYSSLTKNSVLDLASKIADKSSSSTTNNVNLSHTGTLKNSFTTEEQEALAAQFNAKGWTLSW